MKKIKLLLLLAAVTPLTILAMPIASTQQENAKIEKFVQQKYPGAVIIDREIENSTIEIEVIFKSKEIDMLFDINGDWQKTKWDMIKSELPKAVLEAIKSSSFSSYSIDDIEYQESPTSKFYKVDLEKWISDREATLYITPEGKIL